MDAFKLWNLATGSPYEDRYSLEADCKFYTNTPILTLLRLSSPPWQIEIDDAEVLVSNIDQVLGSFSQPQLVNVSSTVHTLFHFDEVNPCPATSTVARIYSDSYLEAEALLLT
tara:strand:+ start:308 stop:646 length:339 start_codon:yes stop_codon:yes gene_type:complete